MVDTPWLGPRRDLLQLKMLHISRPDRKQGLGARLFREAQAIARERGAHGLYISATPSLNTITFYQRLGAVVTPLGHVRFDPHVPAAVRARTPFLNTAPHAPAARGVRRLARDLAFERDHGRDPRGRGRRPGFFASLAARWALGRVAR